MDPTYLSSITPENPRQTDSCQPMTNTHQIIVRLPILTSLEILSLTRYKVSILKDKVGESLTSIRPMIRFLISMGFGWNRGVSCRVTSLIRSLWTMCFRSFIILTIHVYQPPCQILPNARGNTVTSVWCLRSSSILSCVSFRSSVLSTFDETVLILIF